MANYLASARSNYFHVKDLPAFTDAISAFELTIVEGSDGRVALLVADGGEGGWPSFVFDEATDDYIDFDICELLAEHLCDGEVAVLLEVGAEKLRFLAGHAVAVNSKGQRAEVNLNDIYKLAGELGSEVTEASY